VAAIKKLQPAPQSNLPEVDVQGIAVILHPSHPKIGFVGKKISLQNLVWLIESFAVKLDLTISTSKDDNDGYHVCLHLGSGKLTFIQHTSFDKPST
jgi:hypothetical protein